METILAISKQYNKRPSEIIGLTNEYEAFCFDEACIYIMSELSKEDAKEPKWTDLEEAKKRRNRKQTNNDAMEEWLLSNNRVH